VRDRCSWVVIVMSDGEGGGDGDRCRQPHSACFPRDLQVRIDEDDDDDGAAPQAISPST